MASGTGNFELSTSFFAKFSLKSTIPDHAIYKQTYRVVLIGISLFN